MSQPLLQIEQLTKDYKRGVRANDGITLRVNSGEVFGLLGHNGAGKTTLLNQVIGLAKPTSGEILIDGQDAINDPVMARHACSMQPQSQAPLEGLTPRQAIELMARIRGASRKHAAKRTTELLAALELDPWAGTIGEKLSGGVRRLTAFCMAAAVPGRLVMLDEPTNDVDPVRRRLLWQQIRRLGESGCGVVLVTHNVVEAERAVERLAVLDKGRVVAQGSPAELRGNHGDRLRLELTAYDSTEATRLGKEFTGAEPAVVTGRRVLVTVEPENCATAIAWAQTRRAQGHLEEFSVTPVSLEDVYISLVGTEDEGDKHAALVA